MTMEYNVKGLNDLAEQLNDFQIKAGFTDSNITQRLMLVHSEVTEAFEAFRKDKYANLHEYQDSVVYSPLGDQESANKRAFEMHVKDTFEDEIADSIIRLLAMCKENNIDIEEHIQLKMKYNESRGFKFGGKKF